MRKLNSFRDVVQNMFYNEIFKELSSHIEENPSEIDCRSYDVECPDRNKYTWNNAFSTLHEIMLLSILQTLKDSERDSV